MARVCQLFSGSRGNSTFIGNADGGLLVDAGVSAKRLCQALFDIGVDPERLKGVFITHEHLAIAWNIKILAMVLVVGVAYKTHSMALSVVTGLASVFLLSMF